MVNKRIKVAIFTGNRAEYGLLIPIIEAINNNRSIKCFLIVSGSHLEKDFGKTIKEIKKDGFDISEQIRIIYTKNQPNSTSLAISNGIKSISNALLKINPDYFLVYADRFEGFAAVIASTQMNIITCHIEGGDITQGGALDDSVRHAMTKLCHLHFTSNKEAKERIIRMGEEPWRVFNVGYAALDLIKKKKFASKQQIEKKFDLNLNKPIVLFTQHSVTTEYYLANKQLSPSIRALQKLANEDIQVIVTYPNNDIGGEIIAKKLIKFKNSKNIKLYHSIGRYYYHGLFSLIKKHNCKVVCVGNSSSGIKETPYFFCPAVNIGSRQEGRLRANNIIDVGYNAEDIYLATIKCLYDNKFIKSLNKIINPYDGGMTGIKISKIINKIGFNKKKLIRKKMLI